MHSIKKENTEIPLINNGPMQSQIDTDQKDTTDDDEPVMNNAKLKTIRKRKRTLRISSSSSSDDNQTIAEHKTNEIAKANSEKINGLTNLLNKLSEDDTSDSKDILNQLESIIGKERLFKLKALLVKDQGTNQTHDEETSQTNCELISATVSKKLNCFAPEKLIENKILLSEVHNPKIVSQTHNEAKHAEPKLRSSRSTVKDQNTSQTQNEETASQNNCELTSETASNELKCSTSEKLVENEILSSKPKYGSQTHVEIKSADLTPRSSRSTGISKNADNSEIPLKKPVTKIVRKRKTELDKLNQDIMDMFIRDEVLKAQGLRQHKKIQYDLIDNDLIQDELYDTDCSEFYKSDQENEVETLKSPSPSKDSPKSNNDIKSPIILINKECRVSLERLTLKNSQMPVKILADGTFTSARLSDGDISMLCDEVCVPDHPQVMEIASLKDERKDPLETESKLKLDVFLPENELKDADVVTIPDSDDDIIQPLAKKLKLTDLRRDSNIGSNGSTTPSKTVGIFERSVCHLSYLICRAGVNLKCSCERCDHDTFDSQMFQYHIQTRHLLSKWSGSCKLCNSSVSNFGTLLDEYNHMNEVHIKKDLGLIESPVKNVSNEAPKKKRGRKKKALVEVKVKNAAIFQGKTASVTEFKSGTLTVPEPGSNKLYIKLTSVDGTKKSRFTISNTKTSTQAPNIVSHNILPSSIKTVSTVPDFLPFNSKFSSKLIINSQAPSNSIVPKQSPILLRIKNLPGDKLSSISKLDQPAPRNVFSPPKNSQATPSCSSVLPETNIPYNQPSTSAQSKTAAQSPANRIVLTLADLKSKLPNQPLPVQKEVVAVPKIKTIQSKLFMPLRPWLTVIDGKDVPSVNKMLTKQCLASVFKCMGSKCCFYTNKVTEFFDHFKWHAGYQPNDYLNYSRCAYCVFSCNNGHALIQHVRDQHKFDKYACSKCFFRSASQYIVTEHIRWYHKDSSTTFLSCENFEAMDFRSAVAEVKLSRRKFVAGITCARKTY